jgi:hypothetical protein
LGDNPVPHNAVQQQEANVENSLVSATDNKKKNVEDDLTSANPRRADSVDFLDIIFIFSTAVFLVLFVFLLAGNQLPAGVRELLKESGNIGKYLIGAAGGTAFVSQVIRMLIRRTTNRFLLLYIVLAFVLLLGSTYLVGRPSAGQGFASADLHISTIYPAKTQVLFSHTYSWQYDENLSDQAKADAKAAEYLAHIDLPFDLTTRSASTFGIQGFDDKLIDPAHRADQRKLVTYYVICLHRAKEGREAGVQIYMKCGERACSIDTARDSGIAASCAATSQTNATVLNPIQIFFPPSVLAADIKPQTIQSSAPYWTVPVLSTLEQAKVNERGGYTRFDVSLTPSPALSHSNSYQYQLFVNGQAVYFNGFPPEAFRSPFDPSKPIQFAFGLRNLNFSGARNGFEDLELQFTFFNGEVPTVRQTISRKYVALRSDAPGHPLDPSKGVVQDSAVGSFKWEATYQYSSHDDVFTAQALSVPDLAKIAGVKRLLDSVNLIFENQRVVLVARPPLWCNSFADGVIGLVQETTGQVRFTFDKDEVRRLSVWARAVGQKSSISAVKELRATQPYNITYRLTHPCEAKG